MVAKRRVAIYGGTFDPVHLGHLEVARKVSELFEIEKVLFVPAHVAPHKVTHAVTAPVHRHAMLALATQDDPRAFISTFELNDPERRYTVDTLHYFQTCLKDSSELFFIMGADSWGEVTSWREWERLLTMVNHIVVTRPGYNVTVDENKSFLQDRIVDLRGTGKDPKDIAPGTTGERIFITDVVMKDISATEIRRLAQEGSFADLLKLVPGPVVEYVRKYGIYRDSHDA